MWERLVELLRTILGDDHEAVEAASSIGTGDEPLADIEDAHLEAVRDAIRTVAADEGADVSAEDLAALADAHEALTAEEDARAEQAEAERAAADEARARILGQDGEEEEGESEEGAEGEEAPATEGGEETTEGEGEGTEGEEAEGEEEGEGEETTEAEAAETPEPQPVTAAAMTRARPRANRPRPRQERRLGLVASAGSEGLGLGMGARFRDGAQIGEALVEAHRNTLGSQTTGRFTVARGDWRDQYPMERRLGNDAAENTARMEAAISEEVIERNLDAFMAQSGFDSRPDALRAITLADNAGRSLLAAGGLCAPVNVSYDVFQIGSTRRPLRDSLPRFAANRGGMRHVRPPQLSQVGGAVGVHTVAEDEASTTKDILTVTCEDEQTCNVYAVTKRLRYGNFQDRFYPEWTRKYADLAEQQHAREAEDELWNCMCDATGVLDKTAGDRELGAFRDTINDLNRLADHLRYRHRTAEDAVVEWWYPFWVWSQMRQDLYRQLPGDATPGAADRIIASALAEINVIGHSVLDGGDANADFAAPIGNGGAIIGWPDTAETLVGFPGSWVFLDGGTLDLGVVRDVSTNEVNDFETFMETFEGCCHVAPESVCFQVNICPTGKTSAAEDIEPCVPGGSSS